jgi:GT2 family glycosyltransferase
LITERQRTIASRPSVALMILNFNGLRWLKICLPSVMKSTYSSLDVYVVDNGSTDGSQEFVESNYPTVKVVGFEKNLGFAEAYNRATACVGADYFVLLNNDTEVLNPAWIDRLVDRAESDPSIGAVACKLVTMEDHRRLDSVGGMGIKYWRGFVDIGKYEIDRGQYDEPPIAPFSACGAAMLIRRRTFEQVGGFDSKFYTYAEDVDLCWRLRSLGYEIAYEPSARVAHYFSGTAGQKEVDAMKLYVSHRNLLRAIIKNCAYSLSWALRNYFLFSFLMIAGYCAFDPRKAVAVIRAILWNLLNLQDAYARRRFIQTSTTANETEILTSMFPRYARYQSPKHPELRRILNILFERRSITPFDEGSC